MGKRDRADCGETARKCASRLLHSPAPLIFVWLLLRPSGGRPRVARGRRMLSGLAGRGWGRPRPPESPAAGLGGSVRQRTPEVHSGSGLGVVGAEEV